MNAQILLLLGQDGVTNGAIYALLALSIVLVFSVTRVLLVPQGEFVTMGAMTMAALQAGRPVKLVGLLAVLGAARLAIVLAQALARRGWPPAAALALPLAALAVAGLVRLVPLPSIGGLGQALVTLAVVVPLGPLVYDLFFRAVAAQSALVLLIVSIAVHVVLVGVLLLLFGADGARTRPFSETGIEVGPVTLNPQALWVVAATLALIALLWLVFDRTLLGKALRATAMQRLGAELMGISPTLAGQASFALAALVGALSGVLIAPITTLYFDSGFIISLKGFVGAIAGGLASFPVAALGALAVGLVESFSTFWASDYKEVIVFTLVLPFLLWRSLTHPHAEDDA